MIHEAAIRLPPKVCPLPTNLSDFERILVWLQLQGWPIDRKPMIKVARHAAGQVVPSSALV